MQPTIFLSHGGGPCFWMEFPPPVGPHGFKRLREHLEQLLPTLPARPRAVVVVSAHWEASVVTVSSAARPPMFFDYYGFPPHTYELNYPAPGDTALARRIGELLDEAGLAHADDAQRGYDHGVFVPMLIVDPRAVLPVVMVSLHRDLDAAAHVALGRALAPLRADNVLILGSGNVWHGPLDLANIAQASQAFDDWIADTVAIADPVQRAAALAQWQRAPHARVAHRREEHLLPLMVVAGAAGQQAGRRSFHDAVAGIATSCYRFG